jgi:hypothetical protein
MVSLACRDDLCLRFNGALGRFREINEEEIDKLPPRRLSVVQAKATVARCLRIAFQHYLTSCSLNACVCATQYKNKLVEEWKKRYPGT